MPETEQAPSRATGTDGAPLEDRLRCDPVLESVRRARRFVVAWTRSRGLDEVGDSVAVVVAELATNAVLHARTAFEVRVSPLEDGVRVDVCDGSPTHPLSGTLDPAAMSGRGLPLVHALAARWGVDALGDGKCVWAEVLAPSAEPPAGPVGDVTAEELLEGWATMAGGESPGAREGGGRPGEVRITVPALPAADVIAAKTHMDDLLRELQLVLLRDPAADASLGQPGGPVAGDASFEVARRLDAAARDFSAARLQIRSQALRAYERGDPTVALELSLDPALLDAASRYREAVDEAEHLSRGTTLLTRTRGLSRHAAVRHSYLDEIVRQLRAARR